MTSILRNGYTVLNPISPNGVAVQGDASSGSLSQYNNKQTDTISAGDASNNGSVKKLICTDSQDTVNLGSGWTNAGTATDDTTGITGTLYTSSSGDQLLISGGAKVNQAPPAPASPPPAPAPAGDSPASAPAPSSPVVLASPAPNKPVQNIGNPAAQTLKRTINNWFYNSVVGSFLANNYYKSSYISPYSASNHLNTFGFASVKPLGYYA